MAPDYFSLCRRTYSTLPGLEVIRQPVDVGRSDAKGGARRFGRAGGNVDIAGDVPSLR